MTHTTEPCHCATETDTEIAPFLVSTNSITRWWAKLV